MASPPSGALSSKDAAPGPHEWSEVADNNYYCNNNNYDNRTK